MPSADDYGIAYDGSVDVQTSLAAAIAAQPPGTTFTLHPNGIYLQNNNGVWAAPGVTIDGLGASIFSNTRRVWTYLSTPGHYGSGGCTPGGPGIQLSAAGMTVQNLRIVGYRKDKYPYIATLYPTSGTYILTPDGGAPTTFPDGTAQLTGQGDTVRLPKVGLDAFKRKDGSGIWDFTNFETPFYARQVGGNFKFDFEASDTAHVTNDLIFEVLDDDNPSTVIFSQSFTLTGTTTTYGVTFTANSYLHKPFRVRLRKTTTTTNTITCTSITAYGEHGYRRNDGQDFTGSDEFSHAFNVNAFSGITIQDCAVEGIDGDSVNGSAASTNALVQRMTSRCNSRQATTPMGGTNFIIQDSTYSEVGRAGVDFEPGPASQAIGTIIRRVTFENVRNYTIASTNFARDVGLTLEDITSISAGMGFIYGGSTGLHITNVQHLKTYRTDADRVRNGGTPGIDWIMFCDGATVDTIATVLGIYLQNRTSTAADQTTVHTSGNMHITNALVTAPTATPFVLIEAPFSDVQLVGGGGGGGSGATWNDQVVTWSDPSASWGGSGSPAGLPAFSGLAFQQDAFQADRVVQTIIDITLPALDQDAAGTVVTHTAVIHATLAALTQSAVADVQVDALVAQTLAALTQSAEAGLKVTGKIARPSVSHRRWMLAQSTYTNLNNNDPTTTESLFNAYATDIWPNSGTSSYQPGGFASRKAVKYASKAQFEADITADVIGSDVELVIYDPENWVDTPDAEKLNPPLAMQQFCALAHANGYLAICTPSRDLCQVVGSVYTQNVGETLSNAYIRNQVAADGARYADGIVIQYQAEQNNSATYASYVSAAAAQARIANPSVELLSAISSSITGTTGALMEAAADSVRSVVSGNYLTVTTPLASIGVDFIRLEQALQATAGAFQLDAVQEDAFQAAEDAGQPLPALTQSMSGGVLPGGSFFAIIAQTLPSLTQAAAAESNVDALIAQTLPALTQAAATAVPQLATIASQLDALVSVVDGHVSQNVDGTIVQTLPALTQSDTAHITRARWDEWLVTVSDEWLVKR